MARHWAEVGFGTPVVMHLLYVFKILLYIFGGWLFALATKGIDGFTNVGQWWSELIVFQKVVLYTMLFEGRTRVFGPLNNRFFLPLDRSCTGCGPTPFDCHRGRTGAADEGHRPYAGGRRAVRGAAGDAAGCPVHDGTGPVPALDTTVGASALADLTILGLLAVLGLRDKVIFLAARGEVYASLTVTFLFTGVDMIIAAKVVFLIIWMGAATSKLKQALPLRDLDDDVEQPVGPNEVAEAKFFEEFPMICGPDGVTRPRPFQHRDRAVGAPVLFFSHGGLPAAIAAFVMVVFLGILSIPMGVPLEGMCS